MNTSPATRFRTRRIAAGMALTAGIALATATAGATAGTAEAAPGTAQTAQSQGIPDTFASAISIDKVDHTVTLPLFKGTAPGRGTVWFILTESSGFHDAVHRGVNWSPKLRNALGTAAVERATLQGGGGSARFGRDSVVQFSSGVDFSRPRSVVPGPDLYPLDPASHAGPVGDSGYSPLFTFGDGVVYNGAEVANSTGWHGKVLSIDTRAKTVTMRLTAGFYLHRDVLYLSTESSDDQTAALENATWAPSLNAAPTAGSDAPSSSAREAIIPVVNGPTGTDNPQRQGLQSAAAGQGDPLNIIREEPECSDPADPANCSALQYSPLWDVHPVAWTQQAIDAGARVRLTSHQDVHTLLEQGELVNAAPDGPVNHDPEIDGLRATGFVVNCPPMFVAPDPAE